MDLNSGLGGLWTYVEASSDSSEERKTTSAPAMEPGESRVLEVDDVVLLNTSARGSILLTTLRLMFTCYSSSDPVRLGTFALTAIERICKLQPSRAGVPSKPGYKLLQVQGKDLRTAVFAFRPRTQKRSAVQDGVLRTLPRSLQDLHAWVCPMLPSKDPGDLVLAEYERLLSMLGRRAAEEWRLSDVNAAYGVCTTYPSLLMLPSGFSNDEVHAAAAFRARGRLPVFCWQHPGTGAVLSRSGQPLVGIVLNSRSDADEKLVAALTGVSNSVGQPARKLIIADARPRKNALANGALGGGSEPSSHYRSSEVVYLGIDNIHTMKDSGARLREYLDQHGAACSDGSSSLLRSGGISWTGGSTSSTAAAASALADTGWLQHLHALLSGAVFIAAHIALEGNSVLVHCSDGWDRTPALLCTALLMLDPYYRTFEGFQALVELHWAAFGHQFSDRLGVPSGSGLSSFGGSASVAPEIMSSASTSGINYLAGGGFGNSSYSPALSRSSAGHTPSPTSAGGAQVSPNGSSYTANMAPILLQWVDCVCQLLRLFPQAFEFSTAFLVDFLDAALACRFGNFLGNSEKERRQSSIWQQCSSIWDHLANERCPSGSLHHHVNIFYMPKETTSALLPPAAALAPVLTPELYLRWSCPPSAKMSQGGILPRWWDDSCLAQRELQRQVASVLSLQQALALSEQRAKCLEAEKEKLREDLENERRDKEASQQQAAQIESEKDNLWKALEAMGATCHLYPARPTNPDGASTHPPPSCSRPGSLHSGCYGQSDFLGGSSSQVPDPLAVSLSLPPDEDFCSSKVCKTCSKSPNVQSRKRGWMPGSCKRGSSSFQGLQVNFDALSQLSIKESYFGSTQPQIQHTVGT